MSHIHRGTAKDQYPETNKIERRKSLGMRLSASAQSTGKTDSVRQSGTLAAVRHPQTPLSYRFRPPDAVTGGDSLTGTGSLSPVRVRDPHSAVLDDHVSSLVNTAADVLTKKIHQYKEISIKQWVHYFPTALTITWVKSYLKY